jgi:CelD/BcsL family acetyltransferase involved in cellulose biosynthesis
MMTFVKQHNLEPNEIDAVGRITVDVVDNFTCIQHLQEEWDAFVESVGGDIYLTYDWCRTWWEFYGGKRQLRIFLCRKINNLVGVIPVFYEQQWLGPVGLKLAKIVGSDFTMVMINPPVQSDYTASVFGHVFEVLFRNEKVDAVWFGPTGGKYNGLQPLREAIWAHSEVTLLHDSIRSPYTTFLLPKTFDAYVQSLNKRQRGNLRRDLNLIDRSFEMTQDVVQDANTAKNEFDVFVRMHAEQWNAEGKLGHFNDWPMGTEFNARQVVEQAAKGRLRLLRLFANGKVVSYQICFAFVKRWYWRLPARVVGPDWDKFALGRIGLIKEIEIAIAEGVQEIEAGAGHYDYKIKLGGEEHPLYSLLVVRKGRFSRCRARLFMKLSNLLHFCYYRIWFNRLAPKLPLKRRPLWNLWIRTRL